MPKNSKRSLALTAIKVKIVEGKTNFSEGDEIKGVK